MTLLFFTIVNIRILFLEILNDVLETFQLVLILKCVK